MYHKVQLLSESCQNISQYISMFNIGLYLLSEVEASIDHIRNFDMFVANNNIANLVYKNMQLFIFVDFS